MEKHWIRHVGTALVVLVTSFLALDAGMKLADAQVAIEVTGGLGFSRAATRMLGAVLALSTIVYVVPATRVLGAILVTGYLGGAVAVQAQHGNPVPTQVLFGVYVGVALWGSVWLHNAGLRQLMPLVRSTSL